VFTVSQSCAIDRDGDFTLFLPETLSPWFKREAGQFIGDIEIRIRNSEKAKADFNKDECYPTSTQH
jgi:hypothetical protein